MRQRLVVFCVVALATLAACSSETAVVVPGNEDDTGARVFQAGQCFITLPSGVKAYTEATVDSIPVGDSMSGRVEMAQVKLLENGALFYQDRGAGLWFRLDGFDSIAEGDCAPPGP
jgi:hypothetical protein